MAAVLSAVSLSVPGPTSRRGNSRRATWPADRLRTVDGGLLIGRRVGLTGFLSLQPGLDRILREEPPAPDKNAPGQILSPAELVADSPRLQAQGVGELLNGV